MQAVGHHGDVIEVAKQRHHLQHRAARVEDNRVAVVDVANGCFGNQPFCTVLINVL